MKSQVTPDPADKIYAVTGATSGIGRAAARALAELNADLILVGRNERAGDTLVRELRRRHPGARVEFIRADLARPGDVRMLAANIIKNYERIDVLINNAGVRIDKYQETTEGIELTFATNHLSHFLLTCLLVDRLVRAPAARVITVSSRAHFDATAYGDWYLDRANYDRRLAYAKSKLANIMFAYELAERLRNTCITSNAVDPGLVATNFARNNGLIAWLRHLVAHGLRRELVSPRKGAETLVYLAVSAEVAGATGKYFHRNCDVASSAGSYDLKEGRRLWDLSEELTNLRGHAAHNSWKLLTGAAAASQA